MTTTYEAAVTLVAQMSPVDQARLAALLAEQLRHTLQTEPSSSTADEPAFWHLPVDDAELPRDAVPHGALPARAETQAMVTRWFGAPLPEDDARDLALSALIAEWNLDL